MASEKKASSTTKVLAIVLIGGGLALVLCCGGGAWFVYNRVGQMMITEPDAVRARAAAIADITIPDAYQPQMAMDMSTIGLPMTMCMFGRTGGDGGIMLMEMSGPMAEDQEQMRRQFQQGMQQQGQNQEINVTSTETRTYEIDGEEYDFEFVQGTRKSDNLAMRQVMGVIPGKTGAAFLMVFENEANWDESAITGMIESMGATRVEKSEEVPADGATTEEATTPEAGADAEAPGNPEEAATPADGAAGENQ
jgi:hypothetical protein